jgi:hypothetical protein
MFADLKVVVGRVTSDVANFWLGHCQQKLWVINRPLTGPLIIVMFPQLVSGERI